MGRRTGAVGTLGLAAAAVGLLTAAVGATAAIITVTYARRVVIPSATRPEDERIGTVAQIGGESAVRIGGSRAIRRSARGEHER